MEGGRLLMVDFNRQACELRFFLPNTGTDNYYDRSKDAREIHHAAERASSLTNQLLAFRQLHLVEFKNAKVDAYM